MVFFTEASPQPKEENQAANKFIPNFVKNPEFHYANKTIYNTNTKPAKENDEETFATPDENIKTYLSPQSEPMCKCNLKPFYEVYTFTLIYLALFL